MFYVDYFFICLNYFCRSHFLFNLLLDLCFVIKENDQSNLENLAEMEVSRLTKSHVAFSTAEGDDDLGPTVHELPKRVPRPSAQSPLGEFSSMNRAAVGRPQNPSIALWSLS